MFKIDRTLRREFDRQDRHEFTIEMISDTGELLVLRRMTALVDASHAVEAWQGPFSGLHDFLRNGSAMEVKTGAGIAAAVEITSLDRRITAGEGESIA